MEYEANLRPANDGETVWTEQAVRGLIGQHPGGNAGGLVTDARIKDGWVKVTIAIDDPTGFPPQIGGYSIADE